MRISKKKLAALGAFFVVMAAAIGGCGSSIPGNSVATVAGNPITVGAYKHWMYIAAKDEAAEEEGEPVITASDPPDFTSCIKQIREQVPSLKSDSDTTLRSDCKEVFTEFNTEVMDFLIEGYWYQADWAKQGKTYTQADLNKDWAKVKKEEFPTAAELKTYLSESGETQQDLYFQVRVNSIYSKLLTQNEKKVTPALISQYYDKHKSEFGTAQTRDIHLIRTTTQAKAQDAYNALNSGTSWDTVAKQYAADAASKSNGGLLTGVTNGEEEKAANTAIFSAPVNKLVGPVHGLFGYYVIEVTKITPATQQSLKKATAQIKELLTSQQEQDAQNAVTKKSKANWGAKTLCRATYAVAYCAGYKAPKTTTTATVAPTTTATSTTTTASTATGTTTTATSTTGS